MEEAETRACTRCKVEKEMSYFAKAKTGDPRRFVRMCKQCCAELRTPEDRNAQMKTKRGKEDWLRSVMFGLNGRDY